MTKKCLILFCVSLILIISSSAESQKLAVLPQLENPERLFIGSNRIYITEPPKVFIYSKDDFNLIRKFGKAGERSGEFRKLQGNRSISNIDFSKGEIIVKSHERLSYFTSEGDFIKEINGIHPQTIFLNPFGNNYLGSAYYVHVGTGKSTQHIRLYDNNMNVVNEIAESHLGGGSAQGVGGDGKIDFYVFPYLFQYKIYNDRIYLADTYKGFNITVFDLDGDRLYDIEREYEKQSISEELANERIMDFKKSSRWKNNHSFINIVLPDYYPSFRDFAVTDDKIYIFPYEGIDRKQELLVLDLKGKLINKYVVPFSDIKCIYNNKYYYLTKNEFDEWEIQVINIQE